MSDAAIEMMLPVERSEGVIMYLTIFSSLFDLKDRFWHL